jgi:hypothetical protein
LKRTSGDSGDSEQDSDKKGAEIADLMLCVPQQRQRLHRSLSMAI